MPYVDGEFLTDDEYNDWMGFTEENGDGDDDDREDEPRTWTQPWTTDASAGAPPSVHEQGPVNALTPEQHLAYQLFMLENPGDAHRASDALEFDTREAREEAPGDEGVPGAFVTQYHKQTKGPWQQDGETQDPRDPADLAAALIIDRDRGSWEQRLKEEARKAGSTYDPSDLEGIIRNFSYAANAGQDPQQMIDAQIGIYQTRGASGGERDEGGYSTRWADDDPRRWTYGGEPPPGYTGRAWMPPPPPIPAPVPRGTPPLYSGQPPGGGASGAGGAAPPAGGVTGVQSLMGPWTGTAPTAPTIAPYTGWTPYETATPYAPPTPYVPGAYEAPTYAPGVPFVAPTAEQMAADPGYQFRLQQGQEALERSGAARGVTNTGGTLRNILDYGQQAASQEYGNVYNRMANTWGMNEAARQAAFGLNAPQQFQGWAATEAGRLGAYQMTEADRAAAAARNEANRRAAAQFNLAGGQQAWQTEAGRQQQDYANQYRQWTDQYNQWRQQGQDRFNEQWMLANA